jgi:hypothetical protein
MKEVVIRKGSLRQVDYARKTKIVDVTVTYVWFRQVFSLLKVQLM